jgi:hypothetical protein
MKQLITHQERNTTRVGNFPEPSRAEGRKIFGASRRLSSTPRRPYHLSAEGLAAKLNAVRLCKPWKRSTGPRSAKGKMRSSANGLRNRETWRVISRRVVDDDDGYSIASMREIRTLYANGKTSVRRRRRFHFRRLQVRRREIMRFFEREVAVQ